MDLWPEVNSFREQDGINKILPEDPTTITQYYQENNCLPVVLHSGLLVFTALEDVLVDSHRGGYIDLNMLPSSVKRLALIPSVNGYWFTGMEKLVNLEELTLEVQEHTQHVVPLLPKLRRIVLLDSYDPRPDSPFIDTSNILLNYPSHTIKPYDKYTISIVVTIV